MGSRSLVFVLFLFSCNAFRQSAREKQQLVVLPVSGFSSSAKASGPSQAQAVRARDWVSPPASLLEANDSDPNYQAQELTTSVIARAEILAEEVPIAVDARLRKIIDICIDGIVSKGNKVCKIDKMKKKTSIEKKIEHFLGRLARGIIHNGRKLFNATRKLLSFSSKTKEPAFELVSKFFQNIAREFHLSPCQRACLAMCATKMSMDYTLAPRALLPAKNASAEVIWDLGVGVCHEYATLAVGFAENLGVKSKVDMGAGGNGNMDEYDVTEHAIRTELEAFSDVFFGGGDVDRLESCMLTGPMRKAAVVACSALLAAGPENAWPLTLPFAAGTFLSFWADHHYPAFSWGGKTYRSEVFHCFDKEDSEFQGCQFYVDE